MNSFIQLHSRLLSILSTTYQESSIHSEFIDRLNDFAFVVRLYYKGPHRWLHYVADTPQGTFIFRGGAFGTPRHLTNNNVDVLISMDDPIACFRITDETTDDEIYDVLSNEGSFTDIFDDREAHIVRHDTLSDIMICTQE